MTLSLTSLFLYAECHYAECCYAECHYAECCYAECHYAECHYAECRGAVLVRGNRAVVEQLIHDPKFNGLNPVATGTRRERL
jgi:hypothetical protein